jgi:hypothetical protein
MPPNSPRFHVANLLGRISQEQLNAALRNNTNNMSRRNKNKGRLRRGEGSRALVRRRNFRFANNLVSNVFGATKKNKNRNVNLSKALAESRRSIRNTTRPFFERPSLTSQESVLYAQVSANKNTLAEINAAIEGMALPNATKQRLHNTAWSNYFNMNNV